MSERYSVRLSKDYLVFSAGHFITYAGDVCERLHGHNYQVVAEVHGPLDENQYVVDFIAIGRFWKFNLADSAVTIGVLLTFLLLWRSEQPNHPQDSVQE